LVFTKGCANRQELQELFGITRGSLPTTCLGIPLTINYLRTRDYTSLVDKCINILESWQSNTLSFSERVELVKSVLYNTLSYKKNSFNFPISVCKELETMAAKFLWKGKIHAWSWDAIGWPKEEGGLGIRMIADICRATGLNYYGGAAIPNHYGLNG